MIESHGASPNLQNFVSPRANAGRTQLAANASAPSMVVAKPPCPPMEAMVSAMRSACLLRVVGFWPTSMPTLTPWNAKSDMYWRATSMDGNSNMAFNRRRLSQTPSTTKIVVLPAPGSPIRCRTPSRTSASSSTSPTPDCGIISEKCLMRCSQFPDRRSGFSNSRESISRATSISSAIGTVILPVGLRSISCGRRGGRATVRGPIGTRAADGSSPNWAVIS